MISKNIEQMKIEISEHIAADAVIQGEYFDGEKGCFIGCLTHSDDAQEVVDKYGLPIALVRVCENIHEGLSEGEYQDFFSKIGDAIDVDGKDLSKVHWLFLKEILENMPKQKPYVQKFIDSVISGLGLLATGKDWADAAAFDSADAAAVTAAVTAADAVHAAATAAGGYAASASFAANAAGYAADGAGGDAASAPYAATAGVAAYHDARIKQKEIMLRLLKEAPMAVAA